METASRDYLFRALALIRAKQHHTKTTPSARVPGAQRNRARLAQWQVSRVLSHIEASLKRPLRVSELAQVVNLSTSHFFRAFKFTVGVAPFEYITRRRVQLACELMQNTREPLAQIALSCGLCDQAHFCRVFRRLVGQSPNHWRRANSAHYFETLRVYRDAPPRSDAAREAAF